MNPILLWMTSRSRSSMIGAIFDAHGIYTGRKHVTIEAGYTTYENQELKALQRTYWTPTLYTVIEPTSHKIKGFIGKVGSLVPNRKQWLMKTGVEHYHIYQALNPFNIFLTRPVADVAASLCRKVPNTDYKVALDVATWRFELMDQLYVKNGGMYINTDNVINGDFAELQAAMEYCGITFNAELTMQAIT